MLATPFQHQSQAVHMVPNQSIDNLVIHIHLQEVLNKIFKYRDNYVREYNWCILQPKRHDCILKTSPLSDKHSLITILLRNMDLVVSQEAIPERIHLLAAYVFKKFIYKRGQEWIMYTCIIQFPQVDANADFPCLFILDHHRTYPLGFFYRLCYLPYKFIFIKFTQNDSFFQYEGFNAYKEEYECQ